MRDYLIATAHGVAAFVLVASFAGSKAWAGDKEDIDARVTAFEQKANAGDAAGIAAMYTDDALVMPPNSPAVHGSADIEALWKSMFEMGISTLDLTSTEIIVSGDNASEVGTVSYTAGDATGTGKYIVLWVKGSDGTWRLRRDIWNDDAGEE